MEGRPSLSPLRKYLWSGLGFVNATLLRGAVTIRSTTSGGLTYVSFARISFGFQPCWVTVCAESGAARARPARPIRARDEARTTWGKRVISDSSSEWLRMGATRDGSLSPQYTEGAHRLLPARAPSTLRSTGSVPYRPNIRPLRIASRRLTDPSNTVSPTRTTTPPSTSGFTWKCGTT